MHKFLKKENRKIGLALGSGAAKGLAHIGAVKALEERGIPINMIAGSSIGALIGACYAMAGSINDIEALALKLDWKKLARLLDPNIALFFKGVIYGKKLKELLKTIIGNVEFKDLKIPLSIVTTDAETGEEVVINKGSVLEAVRASISIPAVFTPVRLDNRYLMDGGVINPVPVSVVKGMGADFIIACNVIQIPKKGYKDDCLISDDIDEPALSSNKYNKIITNLTNKIDRWVYNNENKIEKMQALLHTLKTKYIKSDEIDPEAPSLFDAMIRALYIMEYEIVQYKIQEADLIIQPDTRHISQFEFNCGKAAIVAGYTAAKKMIEKM